MTSTVSPTARPKAGSVTRVEVSEHGALGAEVAQLVPLGAIHAQGREASGLACWGRVVVALRLGSRTDVLSLHPRAQVDARNHLDFISLSPYHEAEMKTEHTVLRYIFQVREAV